MSFLITFSRAPTIAEPPQLLSGTIPTDLDPTLGKAFLTYKMDGFLKARNVGTFSTIPHFQEIARLYWFGEYIVRTRARAVSSFFP